MKCYIVKTVKEYLNLTKEISSAESMVWFRGHTNAAYMLEPTLMRHKINLPKIGTSSKIEDFRLTQGKVILPSDKNVLDKFKEYYKEHHDCSSFNEIDFLYVMQHYGIATRLLDFTEDPLVALYFALCKVPTEQRHTELKDQIEDFQSTDGWSEEGAAVYCLNPLKMNADAHFLKETEIVDLKNYKFSSLANVEFPFAIRTDNNDPRIIAQKGVFVYFGFRTMALEQLSPIEKQLHKIFIPNASRKDFFHDLKKNYGITHYSIFPDMTGISLEINETMLEEFEMFRKELFDEDQ